MASLVLPILILCAVALWTTCASRVHARTAHQQRYTLQQGQSCRGTVVGVQGPFLFDVCTRVYFEFVPEGAAEPLRGCHVERRDLSDGGVALPATGTQVLISYLPDDPEHAVIGALMRRA